MFCPPAVRKPRQPPLPLRGTPAHELCGRLRVKWIASLPGVGSGARSRGRGTFLKEHKPNQRGRRRRTEEFSALLGHEPGVASDPGIGDGFIPASSISRWSTNVSKVSDEDAIETTRSSAATWDCSSDSSGQQSGARGRACGDSREDRHRAGRPGRNGISARRCSAATRTIAGGWAPQTARAGPRRRARKGFKPGGARRPRRRRAPAAFRRTPGIGVRGRDKLGDKRIVIVSISRLPMQARRSEILHIPVSARTSPVFSPAQFLLAVRISKTASISTGTPAAATGAHWRLRAPMPCSVAENVGQPTGLPR